jgi:hypothetical protein
MTLTQLQTPVMAYQVAMDHHAQNDYQLYLTLTNSVDKDTKGKIQHEKSEFMTGVAGNVPSGLLYFKKLNQMAALSLWATTHDLLNNLFKAYARAECEEFDNFVKDA